MHCKFRQISSTYTLTTWWVIQSDATFQVVLVVPLQLRLNVDLCPVLRIRILLFHLKIIYLYSLLNLYSKFVLYYRFNRFCTYFINRINFLYITAGSEIIKKKNIKIRSGPQHCASPNLYHLPLFSVCESGSERIRIFFPGSGIICSGSGKK